MKAIVVGGGAYGLACAERLARGGASVELIEQDVPAGERAASSARTRVLRYEYGDERDLQRADAAGPRALARARAALGRAALRPARRDPLRRRRRHRATSGRSRSCGRSASRSARISAAEIMRRWPAFSVEADSGLWSPEGGLLWARRATSVLARVALDAGVVVRPHARVRQRGGRRGRARGRHPALGRRRRAVHRLMELEARRAALRDRAADGRSRRTSARRSPTCPSSATVIATSTASRRTTGTASRSAGTASSTPRSPIPRPRTRRRVSAEDIEPLARYLARLLPAAAGRAARRGRRLLLRDDGGRGSRDRPPR